MHAAIFEGPGQPFRIRQLPDPAPGPDELVLKVLRCGICGSDIEMTQEGTRGFPPGCVLGHEFCGEVVAIGRNVKNRRLGDRVTAMPYFGCGRCFACRAGDPGWCVKQRGAGFGTAPGAFAEYVSVASASSLRLPDDVSNLSGALVEPLAVALHGVKLAELSRDLRVVVLGAGPIGLSTLFWVNQAGVKNAVVGSRSRRSAAMAAAMGAKEFLTETEPEAFADALGGPPDIVFECVGKPGVLEMATRIVKGRGRVVVLGFCLRADRINLANCVMKELQVRFSKTYCLADFSEVVASLGEGVTLPNVMVTRTLPLSALPETIESIRVGAPDCKIHINPHSPATVDFEVIGTS